MPNAKPPISSPRSLRLCADVQSSGARSIRWAKQTFDLFPDCAVLWRKANTLIVADPHFGKAAAFRASGVPVPSGTTFANLDRLTRLLNATTAERLIILGDFFHARHGRVDDTLHAIKSWRDQFSHLKIILVRGNHDRQAGDPACEWNIECVDEPHVEESLAFAHSPESPRPNGIFTFAGHVHPCAILRDDDGSTARVPCFHFSQSLAILPAFGEFTGMHPIQPRQGDRVFAAGLDDVFEVRTKARR